MSRGTMNRSMRKYSSRGAFPWKVDDASRKHRQCVEKTPTKHRKSIGKVSGRLSSKSIVLRVPSWKSRTMDWTSSKRKRARCIVAIVEKPRHVYRSIVENCERSWFLFHQRVKLACHPRSMVISSSFFGFLGVDSLSAMFFHECLQCEGTRDQRVCREATISWGSRRV